MPRNLNAKGGFLPSDNVVPVLGAVGRQQRLTPLITVHVSRLKIYGQIRRLGPCASGGRRRHEISFHFEMYFRRVSRIDPSSLDICINYPELS